MKNKIEIKKDIDWEEFETDLRLERQWRESLPYFSDRELLEIFPEAKNVFSAKIAEWMEEREKIYLSIRRKLTAIKYSVSDETAKQIQKSMIEIFDGAQLAKISKHINRLQRLLFLAQKRKAKGGVSDSEVQHALATPIQDILKQKFQRSDNKLIGLCPLHKEKSPSFYIYTKNNSFYCYGCQAGGDAINLMRQLHDFSFVQAVRYLVNA
jgi:hypothetical protein